MQQNDVDAVMKDAKPNQAPTAQAPTRALTKQGEGSKTLLQVIESRRDAIQAIATRHMSAEKLLKILASAVMRNPDLAECHAGTVLECVMQLAELGLPPNTLGSAYLIPFWDSKARISRCQLIIGYRGLMTLARRSGSVSTISAGVVRKGDTFEYEYGLEPKLRHIPKPGEVDVKGGDITHAWASARFAEHAGGGHEFIVMTRGEVDAIRNRSRAGEKGPWVSDYAEMAKKTAIRRLAKLLPLTPEVEHQMHVADRTEFGDIDLTPIERPPGDGDGEGEAGAATPLKDVLDAQVKEAAARQNAPAPPTTEEKPNPLAGAPEPTPEQKAADEERKQKLKEQAAVAKGQGTLLGGEPEATNRPPGSRKR